MIKFFKRLWAYLGAAGNEKFNEKADPKIQLQQAIDEAKDQHRRLREHAASVIASQHLAQKHLDRELEQLEKLNANARAAVRMADEASKAGDAAKAAEYTDAAEHIATQLITSEATITQLREQVMIATARAAEAHRAVETNSQLLQQKLTEQRALLSQLEQAKMQEQMNAAMASLTDTAAQKVPTLAEVREKIETRYAKARGTAELEGASAESHMIEIEKAARDAEAISRLDQIREQLGIAVEAEVIDVESQELTEGTLPAVEEIATATAVAGTAQQVGAS